MKKLILQLAILPFIISCNGQKKPIAKSLAEEPLQLENFDFYTNISTLLPEDTKSKEFAGYYQVKEEMIEVDTVKNIDVNDGEEKSTAIDFRQRSFSSRDILAEFDEQEFNAVNIETTLDRKIMMVNAVVSETSQNDIEKLKKRLTEKYGNYIKTKGNFSENQTLYTWKLKDRIIRYCVVGNDESNTLKLEIDQDKKTMKIGEKKFHYEGYLFIIKNEYEDKIFGKSHSGDFVFVD